jgi:hypothetical protein
MVSLSVRSYLTNSPFKFIAWQALSNDGDCDFRFFHELFTPGPQTFMNPFRFFQIRENISKSKCTVGAVGAAGGELSTGIIDTGVRQSHLSQDKQ